MVHTDLDRSPTTNLNDEVESGLETFFGWSTDLDAAWLIQGEREISAGAAQRITRKLAAKLLEHGEVGQLTGCFLHTGIEGGLLMLAAHLAGIPITFLDRSQPEPQLTSMLLAEGCTLLLVHTLDSEMAVRVAVGRIPVLHLDADAFADPGAGIGTSAPPILGDTDRPALVVFSSGTTGRPKGVIRTVATLSATGRDQAVRYGLTSSDIHGEISSYRFVGPSSTLYGAIASRCRLSFLPAEQDATPGYGLAAVPGWVGDAEITVLRTQAAVMRTLIDLGSDMRRSRLRCYSVAGETLFSIDVHRLRQIVPSFCEVIVVYGSSEGGGMGHACFSADTPIPEGRIRFPRAAGNVAIVDDALVPLTEGTVGEIVTTNVRSIGYWKRESLTDERYIVRPDGTRWYRTGDLGRFTDDGMLEVLGRSDSQVKVRGFNVELTEVEAELLGHPEVHMAAVVDVPRSGGGSSLVGFIVPTRGALPSTASIRMHLADRLPTYKIPSRFVTIDRIPQTAGGKFDRAVLRGGAGPDEDRPIRRPVTPTEGMLHAKMAHLLAFDQLSIDDDFFEVGGDSLSAIEFGVWVGRQFSSDVGTAVLVSHPTVEKLAKYVDNPSSSVVSSTAAILRECAVPAATLVLVAGGGDSIASQRSLAAELQAPLRVIGIQGRGIDDDLPTETSVAAYASRAIIEVRVLAPTGPYLIGGHSFGGIVALEMACQLEAEGAAVAAVVLIDSAVPTSRESEGARLANGLSLRLADLKAARHVRSLRANPREQLRARKGVVFDKHVRALRMHNARSCAAPLLLILASDQDGPVPGAPDRGGELRLARWSTLTTGGLTVLPTPGTHVSIKSYPHVAGVARHIETAVDTCVHRAASVPCTQASLSV